MNDDTLDACLALVADRRRRRLIEHLRQNGNGETPVDDLIDRLHRAEPDIADERQMNRDQLAIQLTHCHLPKLADHGIVEYDPDHGTVEYRPDEQFEAVLTECPKNRRSLTPKRRPAPFPMSRSLLAITRSGFERSDHDRAAAMNSDGRLGNLEHHSRSVGHWTVPTRPDECVQRVWVDNLIQRFESRWLTITRDCNRLDNCSTWRSGCPVVFGPDRAVFP